MWSGVFAYAVDKQQRYCQQQRYGGQRGGVGGGGSEGVLRHTAGHCLIITTGFTPVFFLHM